MNGRKNDSTFYPVVYGLAEGDDWNDEANWYKANPSLGHTIAIERVREAYKNALENPAEENVFKQLRLNMWTNSTVVWIPEHIYDKGNSPIDIDSLAGRDCYAGLDLASTSDITAFVWYFPHARRMRSISCFRFSGCRRIRWNCGVGVTMCCMTSGNAKGTSTPQRECHPLRFHRTLH